MGQPQVLRQQNRQQIVELLLQQGTLTRPQLAERSGLSKVTVNAIVQELLERQVVTLLGGPSQGSGRVPQCVSLHPRLAGVLGLDIQRDSLLYQHQDLSGQHIHNGRSRVKGDLNAHLRNFMQDFGGRHSVAIAVMGVPAPVNSAGQLAEPNALPELDPAELCQALQAQRMQVTFENDANLAALAAAQRFPEFDHLAVLLARESGTGVGLILHGELYRGAAGRAGELGRTPWPQVNQIQETSPEALELLPEQQRLEATAYTLAGLAQTLDLQHVVIGACPPGGEDLARRTAALLPGGISVSVEASCAELVRDGATILAATLGREALLQQLTHFTGTPTGGQMVNEGEGHVA